MSASAERCRHLPKFVDGRPLRDLFDPAFTMACFDYSEGKPPARRTTSWRAQAHYPRLSCTHRRKLVDGRPAPTMTEYATTTEYTAATAYPTTTGYTATTEYKAMTEDGAVPVPTYP